MKSVLIDDDVVEVSGAAAGERVGSIAGALKAAVSGLFAPRTVTPWQSGYDAFYASAVNPHQAGTASHEAWSQGHEAARDAFEW